MIRGLGTGLNLEKELLWLLLLDKLGMCPYDNLLVGVIVLGMVVRGATK